MPDLRLATRRSTLALAQADIVAKALAEVGVSTSIVPVSTSGDRDRSSPVAALTEMGAFVRGVQQTVLEGRADAAVHSCKDLPTDGPPGLVAVYPPRAEPWDVAGGAAPPDWPEGARVGTGSPRRSAQVRLLRPDVEVTGIRGNVETRLAQVASGEVQAVVLAEAGLSRLGLHHHIAHRFDLEEMVPAPAQGAIAVEARRDSTEWVEALEAIDHPPTRRAVQAERALLARTGAGCRSALGAYAFDDAHGSVRMWGFVEDDGGPRRAEVDAPSPEEAAAALQQELGL